MLIGASTFPREATNVDVTKGFGCCPMARAVSVSAVMSHEVSQVSTPHNGCSKMSFKLTNYKIPVTSGRRWDTPTDVSAVIIAHRPLLSAMRSNDDIDWPVHSLMLSFHDLRGLPRRGLPSTCSMVFGSAL